MVGDSILYNAYSSRVLPQLIYHSKSFWKLQPSIMLRTLFAISLFFSQALSYAGISNIEKNFSGTYSCKGNNNKVGDYSFTVTLKLNRPMSHDDIHIYDVMGETENSTNYYGSGLAVENRMSLTLKVPDSNESAPGVGLAIFKLNQEKLWVFVTHYYEPEQNKGVSGRDECTLRNIVAIKKPSDDPPTVKENSKDK